MTPDWQPWPPLADGELIEVEVPGTGMFYLGRRRDHGYGAFLQVAIEAPEGRDGPWINREDRMLGDMAIPPTARWRRV